MLICTNRRRRLLFLRKKVNAVLAVSHKRICQEVEIVSNERLMEKYYSVHCLVCCVEELCYISMFKVLVILSSWLTGIVIDLCGKPFAICRLLLSLCR